MDAFLRMAEQRGMSMHDSVLMKVAALPKMPMSELSSMWKELFQRDAPKYNKPYLVKRIAYRLQEIANNVDTALIEQRLDQYARASLSDNLKSRRRPNVHMPVAGTKLVRIHRNVEHRVTVLDDGFEYQGARYRSLSKIAEEITGAHWSGPVFFGLVRNSRNKE